MNEEQPGSNSFTWTAIGFEMGLAVVAVAIGWLVGFSPIAKLRLTADDWWRTLLYGLLATLPMFVALFCVQQLPLRTFVNLRNAAQRIIHVLLGRCSVPELALISLCAGIGEEVLFRGLLQDGIAAALGTPAGPWVGLIAASAVFGLAHAMTRSYAILATLAGAYLGILLIVTDNLMVPILAHAAYDFGALLVLLRFSPGESNSAENSVTDTSQRDDDD